MSIVKIAKHLRHFRLYPVICVTTDTEPVRRTVSNGDSRKGRGSGGGSDNGGGGDEGGMAKLPLIP